VNQQQARAHPDIFLLAALYGKGLTWLEVSRARSFMADEEEFDAVRWATESLQRLEDVGKIERTQRGDMRFVLTATGKHLVELAAFGKEEDDASGSSPEGNHPGEEGYMGES
jgi:hypothetical protein